MTVATTIRGATPYAPSDQARVTQGRGVLLVLPAVVNALPASLYNDVFRYLPMIAGTQVLTTGSQDPSLLTPWAGTGVFSLYAVAAIAAGAVALRRRDA